MSFLTSFHRFVTSSDFLTGANGASSAAFVAGSNVGGLLMPLDSNHIYHITQLQLGLHAANDVLHLALVSLDSDGAAGARTHLSIEHDMHTPAAPSGRISGAIGLDPPIALKYSSSANFLSCRIEVNDSDTAANIAYSGFTSRA